MAKKHESEQSAAIGELRAYLGGHAGVPDTHLHKEEIAALVLVAGRAAGFLVRTEVPVDVGGTGRRPAMNCGWYSPEDDDLVVAWEFDGRDVADGHIAGKDGGSGNRAKFDACGAPLKVQVLYSVKNDLSPKPPGRADSVRRCLPADVKLVTDDELMRGGIERVVEDARMEMALREIPVLE